MRPLRLEMEGFGTFAKRTSVDFTDSDFFALIGPTGSGKSTILDAMCFALYGRVPRWGSGIEYALAPSATSGKVQLAFGAGGHLYVATRVVKRGSKGKVTTTSAALERLPAETTPGDLADVGALMGTPLAGSATGVGEHAERIIGLPFDQFTKCVLLPQGAFAEFLHSSSADRRKILENLLGYSVYRDIQTAAGAEQRDADTAVRLLDDRLAEIPPVTDDALTAADARITRLRELESSVRDTVPRLDDVSRRVSDTKAALESVDAEHSLLTYIRRPDNVDALAEELATVDERIGRAKAEVTEAEETEQRLREETATDDVAVLDAQLKDYDEAATLADRIDTGRPRTEAAEADAARAANEADAAATAVAEAEAALEHAQTHRLATTLRRALAAGDDCPVCAQPVARVPEDDAIEDLAEAQRLLSTARDARKRAEDRLRTAQATAAKYRATLDDLLEKQEAVAKRLAQVPPVDQLRRRRLLVDERREALTEATKRVRSARDGLSRRERARETVAAKLTDEWRKFDHHRDRVAALRPPTADRGDLAASWTGLAEWAARELADRRRLRAEHAKRLEELSSERRVVGNELSMLLTEAGLPPVTGDSGADYVAAVAAGTVSAVEERRRLGEQREAFIEVTAQRAGHATRAQVAKQLHQHLGTRQFVNWLLTEALEDLVNGASVILNQITGGQYDLGYDGGDFVVVDHHDADLTRPVKTLSGGETFAASLALALAMSKQLAGMSTQGANLEAILLDEGFGTLDAATLDQVAATLEGLADSGDRMVGVITHVPALAERIPVRFEVTKDTNGSRVTRVEGLPMRDDPRRAPTSVHERDTDVYSDGMTRSEPVRDDPWRGGPGCG